MALALATVPSAASRSGDVRARVDANRQAPGNGAPAIEWHTRLDPAREAALMTNRPMLLEFWAGWCAPCKFMDANVYTDARVAAAMEKVLPVRIDVDTETVLTRKYRVESMPTIVFTDSHGNELFRYSGLLTVDQMLPLLEALPGDVSRINRLSAALEENEDDFEALKELGRELSAAGLYRSGSEHYRRAVRTKEAGRRPEARAAILVAVGRNHLALREFDDAEKAFERARRDGRGTTVEADAMLGLAEALAAKRKDGSRQKQ
jgi:thioredoxin-like negative regulator of GroEL